MMLREVTKATNSLVADCKYLILIYPFLWFVVWAMASSISGMLEESEKFDARVKASLERIKREEADGT